MLLKKYLSHILTELQTTRKDKSLNHCTLNKIVCTDATGTLYIRFCLLCASGFSHHKGNTTSELLQAKSYVLICKGAAGDPLWNLHRLNVKHPSDLQ